MSPESEIDQSAPLGAGRSSPTPASFRYAMGHFATGVTVMTTAIGSRQHGMTVSAFASVSLLPLLILVSVERSTVMHDLVLQSGSFALNFLGERSESTARFFADDSRLDGPEFREGAYRPGVTGSPFLNEATGVVEASIEAHYRAGDHSVIVGKVLAVEVFSEEPPLIYYRSGYRRLG